jgi:hypothetical protein
MSLIFLNASSAACAFGPTRPAGTKRTARNRPPRKKTEYLPTRTPADFGLAPSCRVYCRELRPMGAR